MVVFRSFVSAVAFCRKLFWVKQRRSSKLNNPLSKHTRMFQLFPGMLFKLCLHFRPHRSFYNKTANPILVVCQPFVCKRLVKLLNKLFCVFSDNLLSLCSHFYLPL